MLTAANAYAAFADEVPTVIERVQLDTGALITITPAHPTHALQLTLVVLEGVGWRNEEILDAVGTAANLLGQCGLQLVSMQQLRIEAPSSYLDFYTPRSRELARQLAPSRPTIYFIRDTRQQPAFDAEAIGRGNSRSRPELADSVWVTRAAPDLAIVLAHELFHVLSNNGAHVDLPDNLMRDESNPRNTKLTEDQCADAKHVGSRHGLLKPMESERARPEMAK